MLNTWLLLVAAIVLEVGGTTCLKLSHGLSKALPSAGVVVLYGLSFWALALVLKKMEVGPAYAVWSGLGTTLVAIVGVAFFGDKMTALKLASIGLIILGIAGLNLSGTH